MNVIFMFPLLFPPFFVLLLFPSPSASFSASLSTLLPCDYVILCDCMSCKCTAACGCVQLRVVACGCVWLRVDACGCVWLRVAACGCVWLRDTGCRCVDDGRCV